MQLLQKILAQNRKHSWRIESRSNPGKFHVVFWSEMYGFECGKDEDPDTMDCIAFQMSGKKRSCRHIEEIKQKFDPKGRINNPIIRQRTMVFQDEEKPKEVEPEEEEKKECGTEENETEGECEK